MITVSWTPLARQRFDEFINKIAEENKVSAQNIAQKILKKVKHLEQFPEMGRIVPELNHKLTREVLESNYRIIYRYNISRNEVLILTIRHVKERLIKPADKQQI